MVEPPIPAQSHNPRTSDHLANERTFLAWIRTSIAVIGLGFVVARFSLWLRQMSTHVNGEGEPVVHHTGLSLPMGIAMMAFGGLLAIIALNRYHRVRVAIETESNPAAHRSVGFVTAMVVIVTAAMIGYMLVAR